jgi:lipid A 3-O-deacylase
MSRTGHPMINLNIGEIGVADHIGQPLRYGIEYRSQAFSKWNVIPAIGYTKSEGGTRFLYASLLVDFSLSSRWIMTPSFGLGSFGDGKEIHLGKELEFRSGIEIAYRIHRRYRVGLALFHFSNGGLSEINPGTEALVFSIGIPLGD